jgi:hypothetical protein
VNGTTTNIEILNSGGVAVVETEAPGETNSSAAAQGWLAPPQSCITHDGNTTCQTESSSGSDYVVIQNGLSIVVNPNGNELTWLDGRNQMWVDVVGGTQSIPEILALANTLTQPTSTVSP